MRLEYVTWACLYLYALAQWGKGLNANRGALGEVCARRTEDG